MEAKTDMKEVMMDQIRFLYRSEKSHSLLFHYLKSKVSETGMNRIIDQEIEENRTQCERFEGILAILHEDPERITTENNNLIFDYGSAVRKDESYQAAIAAAKALNYNEIVRLLIRASAKSREFNSIHGFWKENISVAA